MTIERAVLEHVPQLHAIDHVVAVEQSRADLIARAVDNGTCWIALEADKVLGYAILDYDFFRCGFVHLLYIHRERRRRGLGSQLMAHLETVCTTAKLFTSTNQSNLPSQRLLEKLGYRPSGIVENLDEGDPELIYFKRLSRS